MDPTLPSPLSRAVQERRLVVLAGSAISALAPSYLPDWKGFNTALLEEIKELALDLPPLDADAAAAVRNLSLDLLAPFGSVNKS